MKSSHIFWIALSSASLLAAACSLFIGMRQSLWFDEAYSVLLAEHSWSDIVRLTAQDVHPPVYYWLLKAWMLLFGSGELAVRSLSALLLGLSVVVAGLLLRRFFGAKVALMTLPFLLLAPFLLRYGFEIRMYSLCSLLGIGATYVLVAAVEEKRKKERRLLFLAYALLVAVGVYTLYFMVLLWIAHLAWIAWLAYSERRRDVLFPAIFAYVFAFGLFIPWLPVFLGKAGGSTLSAVTNKLDLENIYGIITYLFLYRPPWDLRGWGIVIVACIVALVAYLAVQGYRNASAKERRYLALLVAYFFVPVAVLAIVTQFLPIYIERYTAHIAIGLYALIGVLAVFSLRSKKRMNQLAVGGLLIVLAFGCFSLTQFGNYNFQRLHRPSIKQVAALLADCKNGAVIFADGPQVAMELDYYIKDCPVYFFNETLEMGGGFAMISYSPLRVASSSDLPETNEIMHVYYDEPKNTIPSSFHEKDTDKVGAVNITTYRSDKR